MSNLGTKSVMLVIQALIMRETNPEVLQRLVYGNTENKKSGKLREALTGNLKEHYRQQLEWEKQEYDLFEKQKRIIISVKWSECKNY